MSEEELRKTLKDCVNELCLYCGRYKERHLGACDGCRWKKVLELATNLQPTCNNVATNADRIRGMSDEDLAKWMANILRCHGKLYANRDAYECPSKCPLWNCCNDQSSESMEVWLKEGAKT